MSFLEKRDSIKSRWHSRPPRGRSRQRGTMLYLVCHSENGFSTRRQSVFKHSRPRTSDVPVRGQSVVPAHQNNFKRGRTSTQPIRRSNRTVHTKGPQTKSSIYQRQSPLNRRSVGQSSGRNDAASPKEKKNWAASTLFTKMAQAQGALRLIFPYLQTECSIVLKGCVRWNVAMKGVAVRVQQTSPTQPKAISEAQVKIAQKQATSQLGAVIELAWLLAGRGGDILQLLTADIKDHGKLFIVTFRRGKTARRQQYDVGIPRPSTKKVIYLRSQKTWAFPGVTGEALKDALRRVDPELEQRSLRRGRLLHLAAKGWTDIQLLESSRHCTGHAASSPRHGGSFKHHRCNRTTSYIPSSQRRLQGFLNEDFGDEDCPSAEDMQKAFPNLKRYQKRQLTIVIKRVDPILESALWSLPSEHEECLRFAKHQLRWITSTDPYKDLSPPSPRLISTGFTADEERQMMPQKIQPLHTEPLGSVYGFKVGVL